MSNNLEELLKTIKERAEYHAYQNDRYNVENKRSFSTFNIDFDLKNSLSVKWRQEKDFSFCEIYENNKKVFYFESSIEGEDFNMNNLIEYDVPNYFKEILQDYKNEFDESTKWYKQIKEMLNKNNNTQKIKRR